MFLSFKIQKTNKKYENGLTYQNQQIKSGYKGSVWV